MFLLEIASDNQLRLFTKNSVHEASDAEIFAQIKQQQEPVMLLDATHIQSKQFNHPVNDSRILEKVILADLRDYLLDDPSHYDFAYQKNGDTIWVSWLEKSFLAQLKQRLAPILPLIIGLSALPLWLATALYHRSENKAKQAIENALYQADFAVVFQDSHFFYALLYGETMVMTKNKAHALLTPYQTHEHPPSKFNLPPNIAPFLQGDYQALLPNLWQKTVAKSQHTVSLLTFFSLLLVYWLLSALSAFMQLKELTQVDNQLLNKQTDLLHQVLPDANSADAYGRLNASYLQQQQAQHTKAQVFKKLNSLLQDTPLKPTVITADLANNQLGLDFAKAPQQQSQIREKLENNGFTLQIIEPNQWLIHWPSDHFSSNGAQP